MITVRTSQGCWPSLNLQAMEHVILEVEMLGVYSTEAIAAIQCVKQPDIPYPVLELNSMGQ